MKIRAFIILLLFSFSSCTFIRFITTVKDPQNENQNDNQQYVLSLGFDTTFSYQLCKSGIDSLSQEKYVLSLYKYDDKYSASVLQLRMYDHAGNFIQGWEQCFWDLHKLGVLDSFPLKRISHLQINYNLKLQQDISLLNISNQSLLDTAIAYNDYVLIVYYARWTGWFCKDLLKAAKKYVAKHQKEQNILLILVNTSP
ncbi:MAG: hypothetical protein LBK03_07645 [Bacteroidales bacterium]|jgi:hypothetical protein|nr:hypothetical protein [Bacteroidales bacterium]